MPVLKSQNFRKGNFLRIQHLSRNILKFVNKLPPIFNDFETLNINLDLNFITNIALVHINCIIDNILRILHVIDI